MKTLILNITFLATLAISMPLALAEAKTFPEAGRSYNVTWAQNANLESGQIKVITKGDAPWIFVEYTFTPVPQGRRTTQADGEKPKSITRRFWINTQWIVSASELDARKD